MRTVIHRSLILLVLALAACAPEGPRFASIAGTIPPVQAGTARIYFYRWLEPYETMAPTVAFLNGQPVALTETGTVLYRDVAPGQYTIAVDSRGTYPDQFKTVTLAPGQTAYARIESLRSWSNCGRTESGCYDTFTVQLLDPGSARAEMSDLRFIRG